MPQETFTQYPVVQDGYLDVNNEVQGDPTIHNKDWWENQLYAWIVTLTQGTSYPYKTPGEMIDDIASGNYAAPLSITSTSNYTNNATADNTTVYVAGSMFTLAFPGDVYEVFSSGFLQFDDVGNFPITFTNPDRYKRINIGVDYVASAVQLVITESDEATTIEGLGDPGNYSASWKYCGYVILHDVAGTIQAVTQDDIVSYGYQVWSSFDSGLTWKGLWDADTNTPDISATTPVKGDYYIVSVEGTTGVGGITDWDPGDYVLYDGTAWNKLTPDTNYALTYRGVWDADANSPDLTTIEKELNDFWVVNVAGNTDIGGIITWELGDQVLWDATGWVRVAEGVYTMRFQGDWDAYSNDPDYATLTPENGDYWVVSREGTTDVNGISVWEPGNYLLYTNSAWTRIETTGGSGGGGVGVGTGAESLTYVGPISRESAVPIVWDYGMPHASMSVYKSLYFHHTVFYSSTWRTSNLVGAFAQAMLYDQGVGTTELLFKTQSGYPGRRVLYTHEDLGEWVLTPQVAWTSEGSRYDYTSGTSTLYLPASASAPADPVTDIGGNAYTITNNGLLHSTGEHPLGTSALFFTGIDDLEIADASNVIDFGTGDFTISFHIKAATDGNFQSIFCNHYTTATGWRIYFANNGNIWLDGINRTSTGWTQMGLAYVGDNAWHHIVISKSGSSLRSYKDGVISQTYSDVIEMSYFSGPFAIGKTVAGGSFNNFTGLLSDIIIQKGTGQFETSVGFSKALFSEKQFEDGKGENPNTQSYLTSEGTNTNAVIAISSTAYAAPRINSLIFTGANESVMQYVAESTPLDPYGYNVADNASNIWGRQYSGGVWSQYTITGQEIKSHVESPTKHYPQEDIDHTRITETGRASHVELDTHTELLFPTITNAAAPIELSVLPADTEFSGNNTKTFATDISASISNWNVVSDKAVDVAIQLVNDDDNAVTLTYKDQREDTRTVDLDLPPIGTLGYARASIENKLSMIPQSNYHGNALYIPGNVNDANLPVFIKNYTYQNGNGGAVPYSNTQAHLGTYSLYFNGSDYIEVTSGSSDFDPDNNRPMSIGFWIYTTDAGTVYPLSNTTNPATGWYVALNNGSLIVGGVDGADWTTGITGVNDGAWHYVSITKDGTDLYAWLDGANQQTTAFTSISHDDLTAVFIGSSLTGYMEDIIITREILWDTTTFSVPTTALEETTADVDVRQSDFYLYSNYTHNGSITTPAFYNMAGTHDSPTITGTVSHTTEDVDLGTSAIRFVGEGSYISYPYHNRYHMSDDKPWSLFFRFKPDQRIEYCGVLGWMNEDWDGFAVTYEVDDGYGILYLEGFKTSGSSWESTEIDPVAQGYTHVNLNDGNFHSVLISYYPTEDLFVAWIDGKYRCELPEAPTGFTNETDGFFIGTNGDTTWTEGTYRGDIKEVLFMNHTEIFPSTTETFDDSLFWYQYSEQYAANVYISPLTTEDYLVDKSVVNHELYNDGVTVNTSTTAVSRGSLEFDGASTITVENAEDISYLYGGSFSISFRIKTSQTAATALISSGSTDGTNTWTVSMSSGQLSLGIDSATKTLIYNGNLADDAWHYVVITDYGYDGTIHCIVDGTDSGLTATHSIFVLTSGGELSIGGCAQTAYADYNGLLSDVTLIRTAPVSTTATTPNNFDAYLPSGIVFDGSFTGYDMMLSSSQIADLQLTHMMFRNTLNGAIASWPVLELGGGAEIDDTSFGADVAWSADKISTELTQIAPELAVTDGSNTAVNVDYLEFDDTDFTVQDFGDGEVKVTYTGVGGGGGTGNRLTWKINGAVPTGANVDMSRRIGRAGTLTNLIVMLENTGVGGAPLVLDLKKNGISITSTNPTIPPASGTFQSIVFSTFDSTAAVGTDYFTIDTISVPTSAVNMVAELIVT